MQSIESDFGGGEVHTQQEFAFPLEAMGDDPVSTIL